MSVVQQEIILESAYNLPHGSVGAGDGYEHSDDQDAGDRRDLDAANPLGLVDLKEAEAGEYDCRHGASGE